MADLVDLLDAEERSVFDNPGKSFVDDTALDAVIIKWLNSEGRTADAAAMKLYDYLLRQSAGQLITGKEFLEWYDTNSLADGASAEGQARMADLRGSDQYQGEDIKGGEFSSLIATWRKELEQKHFDLWDEWWKAWQALRQKYGVNTKPSTAGSPSSPVGAPAEESQNIPRYGFGGDHAWVNSLDDRQWAVFSGGEGDLDHNECLRTWATATHNEEVLADLDLFDYLMSLTRTDSKVGSAEFLAWYDGGWSDRADPETRRRVEALRRASATEEVTPAEVGSAGSPWRKILGDRLHDWNDQWWAAWTKAQEAGGYSGKAVKIDDDYADVDLQPEAEYVERLEDLEPDADEAGRIVEGYASDNALNRLFDYLNQSDIASVMESVERVDGGTALDRLALDYPKEFVGWLDAAANEQVQQALLARREIANVVRAVRAVTDQGSAPAVQLSQEDLSAIDRVNREAIRSIERGGEAQWLAGGTAVLIGDGHDAQHYAYHDAQRDRVGGRVIVRRVRVGTGPVVFFNVPPAKQQLVESAARRATRRRPVFENE